MMLDIRLSSLIILNESESRRIVSLSHYFDFKKKLNSKKLRFYLGRLRNGKGKGSLLFVRERSSMEDEHRWKTTFNGR